MYKALVVDDEPIILKGFDNLISWEEFGIEIAAKAENGKAALQIARKEKIDLLITDIRMPEMSGLELLKTIRREGKNIKVIILSGYDDFQYVKEASKYGIENYLLKPIEENELEETLLHLTEKLENEQKQQNRLQESYQLLRSNILYRWITGTIGEEELTMEGNIIQTIRDHVQEIGYFHVADVPGRMEPGTGEMNFKNIIRALGEAGYDKIVGFEFSSSQKDSKKTLQTILNQIKRGDDI